MAFSHKSWNIIFDTVEKIITTTSFIAFDLQKELVFENDACEYDREQP